MAHTSWVGEFVTIADAISTRAFTRDVKVPWPTLLRNRASERSQYNIHKSRIEECPVTAKSISDLIYDKQ